MRTVLEYLINMMPYMAIAIPFYLILRVLFVRRKQKPISLLHEILLFVFVIYLVGLASQTVIPKFEIGMSGGLSIVKDRIHETNLIPFKVLSQTYTEVFAHNNISYFIINFVGNLMVFVPIGLFVPLLWRVSGVKVILIGCGSSVFIEVCQLFLRRGTDIDDVILNTIGTCIGLLLYYLLRKICSSFVAKCKSL